MTPKEALQESIRSLGIASMSHEEEFVEYYKTVIEALEKADKYRWHDLWKDPYDLPEIDGRYYIAFMMNDGINYGIATYHVANRYFTSWYEPVAWREIEPFMEEKE